MDSMQGLVPADQALSIQPPPSREESPASEASETQEEPAPLPAESGSTVDTYA